MIDLQCNLGSNKPGQQHAQVCKNIRKVEDFRPKRLPP